MSRNKAIQLIQTFSPTEVKKFELFLESPYFNSSKKIARFYNILIKFYPGFNSQKFTNRFLKKKMGTTSDSTINNLYADLIPLTQKFIAYLNFESDPIDYELRMVFEYEKRKLFDLGKSLTLELEEKINNKQHFHPVTFYNLYILQNCKFNNDTYGKPVKNSSTLHEHLDYYNKANSYIFLFYLMNLIPAYIMNVQISKMMDIDESSTKLGEFFKMFFDLNKIEEFFNNCDFIENELIKKVLRLNWLYMLIRTGNNIFENSKKYIDILFDVTDKLHKDEKYNLFTVYNHWFPEIIDHPEFEEYEFKFYDEYLKQEAYKSTGYDCMSIRNFIFIYTRADSTGRYEWCDKFIEKYQFAVSSEYRLSLISLRSCNKYIVKEKNYEKALLELLKVKDHNEVKIKRDVKYFGIIINYELKNYDTVLNYIENLYKFLNKKDIPKIERDLFSKFLSYIKMITNYQKKEINHDLNKLRAEIINCKFIPSKNWLIEKINDSL